MTGWRHIIFSEAVKVQRFCLTLVGEARFWHESLRPIVVDWQGLQDQFRQQYSKIGNIREELVYVWRSFHYDKKPRNVRYLCNKNQTSSSITRLW